MFTMEKYAVIKLASKQYLVHEGDIIELERQQKPLNIDVIFYFDGQKAVVGEPTVSGLSVKASVLEEKLGKKVRVARFKKKSRYERVRGHRQPVSIVKIEKIGSGKDVEEEKAPKQTAEKKSEDKVKVKETKAKVTESKSVEAKKPVKKAVAKAPVKKVASLKADTKLKGSK